MESTPSPFFADLNPLSPLSFPFFGKKEREQRYSSQKFRSPDKQKEIYVRVRVSEKEKKKKKNKVCAFRWSIKKHHDPERATNDRRDKTFR